MLFVNLTDKTLRFSVRDVAYDVAPRADCEIPDSFAYVVKSRGLPLTLASEVPPQRVAAAVAPVASVRVEETENETPSAGDTAAPTEEAPAIPDHLSRRGRRGR